MYAAIHFLGAHAFQDTLVPGVYQVCNITFLGAFQGHHTLLSTAVNKGFQRLLVHLQKARQCRPCRQMEMLSLFLLKCPPLCSLGSQQVQQRQYGIPRASHINTVNPLTQMLAERIANNQQMKLYSTMYCGMNHH